MRPRGIITWGGRHFADWPRSVTWSPESEPIGASLTSRWVESRHTSVGRNRPAAGSRPVRQGRCRWLCWWPLALLDLFGLEGRSQAVVCCSRATRKRQNKDRFVNNNMQGTVAHYSNVALRFAHEGINVTFLAAWDIPKCELSHWNKGHLPPLEIRYYLKILLKGKCDERWWWPSAVDIPFERNSVHPTTTYYRERVRYIDIENSFASIMHLPSNARLFPRILVC